MINLYAVHIQDNLCTKVTTSFMHLLSEERIEKVKKYRMQDDQVRGILGEVLLKYILWEHYGTQYQKVFYQYNKYGKPSLADQEGIYFNISHSGNWVLCGVSVVPIGVDVEGGDLEVMSIAKRFFTREEYAYIQSQKPSDQKDIFYKLWTLKESYVKCIGKGLQIPIDSFGFEVWKQPIEMFQNGIIDHNYIFWSRQLEDGYYTALCARKEGFLMSDSNIRTIPFEELLSWSNRK